MLLLTLAASAPYASQAKCRVEAESLPPPRAKPGGYQENREIDREPRDAEAGEQPTLLSADGEEERFDRYPRHDCGRRRPKSARPPLYIAAQRRSDQHRAAERQRGEAEGSKEESVHRESGSRRSDEATWQLIGGRKESKGNEGEVEHTVDAEFWCNASLNERADEGAEHKDQVPYHAEQDTPL